MARPGALASRSKRHLARGSTPVVHGNDAKWACDTPEMRHQRPRRHAETALAMDANEITFEDLLAAEPQSGAPADSFAQLLADGFPPKAGVAELAAIARMGDPGPKFAALRHRYQELLEAQLSTRPARVHGESGGEARASDRACASVRRVVAPDTTGTQ